MPGTDPFLTYAEDTSGKVDMAQNIERGVNDRSVFDQEYYTGKDKVTPSEAQPPAMPPAVAAPLPGSSEYRANPFTGQGPEISTITGHPIKKWGIAAQEPVPSHEVYKPPPEPWDQIALKTWKGIGLQAEKIAAGTVRLAADITPGGEDASAAIASDTKDLNARIAENQPGEGATWAQRQAFGLGLSLPIVVAAVGGGIVTKAPGFAGYLMGFTSGVEKYSDLKDYGYDTGKAAIVASLYGSADAIFFGKAAGEWQAMLTAGKAATPTLERTAIEHVSEWAGQAFKKYGVVIGAMELNTAAKSVVSKLSDQPNMTAHDFAESMFDTLVQGTAIHAGMTAAGAAAGLARKTDRGPADFKGYVEQNFEGAKVDTTDFGARVDLPNGRSVEIHTADSPQAAELQKAALATGDAQTVDRVKKGESVISGVFFKSGDLVGTENDLIYLSGQGTDLTTLPHEKGHLVVSMMRDVMTPEEMAAIGLPDKGSIPLDIEEKVMTEFEQYAYKRTPSIDNPMSPLDEAFHKVVDFAHEIYSTFGGETKRNVFEQMRTGKILQREGAVQLPGETAAQFQVRTIRPPWHEPDVKTKSGVIVGAPGSHLSSQSREGLIRKMVNVATKMHEVNPEQAKWYDMSGEDVRRLFGLVQKPDGTYTGNVEGADQFLRAVAQWSIQADVGRNVEDAVNVIHQLARGEEAATAGVMTNAQTQAMRFVDTMAASEVSNDIVGFGEKATSFYWDLHNATFKVTDKQNTTIDRHIIGGWDLASRTGRPMEALKGPQYRWANNVMGEITKRFNAQNKTDYTPSQIQPLLWAWQRGGRVFEKGNVDHIGSHLGVGIVTGEIVPATNSDVTPWIHEANYETKRALSTHVLDKTLYDENGNNVILSKLQMPQGGVVQGMGTYEGAVNPNVISTMALQGMRPELANLYADLFGYIYTQNAVPWYRADRSLSGVDGVMQGYAVARADGPIADSLVRSFYDILKTKIKGGELTFLGDEIHVVNFMGLDQTEFHAKIQEVADEWAQKNDIASKHWQFGTEGDYRKGDADGAGRWTGQEYLSRISAAGSSALRDWAGSQREAAVAAAREFSDQVAPPGAKFQAKSKIDDRFKVTLTDINGKDITPAVKAITYGMGEPIRSVQPPDRIWLTGNGKAIGVPYVHQSTVDDIIAKATSEPIGKRIDMEQFGAATQSIRFHGLQTASAFYGVTEPSLNFEVFGPVTDTQMKVLKNSVTARRSILVDVTSPDGERMTYVQGKGPAALSLLKETVDKAYAPGAKLQTKPMVTTPHGEFPMDHNGWKFEGEMYGYYQYTSKDPSSPSFGTTILVDKPENLQAKIEASDKKFAAPKMQTKEFKDWFGDSKVVDAEGKPLVVYHGTRAEEDFSVFHENSHFGDTTAAITKAYPWEGTSNNRLIPVYLSISNPKRVGDMQYAWKGAIEKAKKEGHDGLVYTNDFEGGGDSYIAFRPDQIKSVFNAKPKVGDPLFQTRTPGPKGLTVNFTDPEVTALGEELLRGAFEKLQFTQSNDASLKKAQELIASKKMSLDTFLNHDPYTAWPDTAHQVAAEAIAGGVFDYVKGRIAEYDAGRITADEANKARMVGMASIASWYLPQSEVARMLQARQMAISPEGIPIRDLMAEQMKFETDLQEMKNRGLIDDSQILDAMSKFYSVDQAQNFVSRVAKAKVKEPSVLNQLFYFSLLSNPVTHAANVVGNVGPLFFAVAEQYLAEKSPFGATPKGGAAGMAAGLVHSIFDAYALMKRSAYTGEAMFGPGKVEGGPARTGVESIDQARTALNDIHNDPTHPYHDPASSEFDAAKRDVMLLHRKAYNPISGDRVSRLTNGNMDASGFFPRMADFIGEAIDAPFKGLNAEDMFFKVLNQRMWIWKSAYEMAAQQGLEGDAFDKFVATFVEDPPPTTMATAEDFALKQTFNNEPGKIAEAIMGITRQYPIARFILPFVRVPSNIFRFALETTPFAPLLRQVRSDISNGGKARDMALSKMAIGTSMMAGVATLAAAGMITGGGPSDPKQKKIWTDSGWQEYSVKINGTYYSYKRLDPFAMPIGVAADLVEMARFAPDFGFDEAALVGALSFIRNFTSKSYMQGFADFLTAITAGGEDTMLASATKYGKGLPRTLVPGGVAQVARVTDPMKRNVDGWIDTLKSRIPGLSSTLEPNYNLRGDPITIGMYESTPGKGFGMINPVLWSEDTKDPVWQEIRRNRVPVTMPARTIGGQDPSKPQLDQAATGQKLTPEQYSWLVKMAGNGLKDPKSGRGAWDELTAIINGVDPVATFGGEPIFYAQKNEDGSPVFTDGPDGGKAMIIQKVIGKYREGAKRILEGGEPFPELHNEYVIGQTKKKMNRAPQVGGAR